MIKFNKIKASSRSITKRKLVNGIGINDADYMVTSHIKGKKVNCPIYAAWKNILNRCYLKSYQTKNPTYIKCSICDSWKYFSNFSIWYVENFIKGYDIDKDIKVKGNTVYSPDTCLFVPRHVNYIMKLNPRKRKLDLPTGVCLRSSSGRYYAKIKDQEINTTLGTFDTSDEASKVYKKAKNKIIINLMTNYPEFSIYLSQHLYSLLD